MMVQSKNEISQTDKAMYTLKLQRDKLMHESKRLQQILTNIRNKVRQEKAKTKQVEVQDRFSSTQKVLLHLYKLNTKSLDACYQQQQSIDVLLSNLNQALINREVTQAMEQGSKVLKMLTEGQLEKTQELMDHLESVQDEQERAAVIYANVGNLEEVEDEWKKLEKEVELNTEMELKELLLHAPIAPAPKADEKIHSLRDTQPVNRNVIVSI